MKCRIEKVYEYIDKVGPGFSRSGYRIVIEGEDFSLVIDTTIERIIAKREGGEEEIIPLSGRIADFLKDFFDEFKEIDDWGNEKGGEEG